MTADQRISGGAATGQGGVSRARFEHAGRGGGTTAKQDTEPTVPALLVIPIGEQRPSGSGRGTARRQTPHHRRTVRLALAGIGIVVAGGGATAWLLQPKPVRVVSPQRKQITETIAASGLVGGYREVVVGSQASGIVKEMIVIEGDHVRKGQALAIVENTVAEAQVRQARQALETAQVEYVQQAERPLPSEIQSAGAHAETAAAAAALKRAIVRRAATALLQATVQETEARDQLASARAALDKAAAERALTAKTFQRSTELYAEGAIARQSLDQAQTDDTSAAKDVDAAAAQVRTAQDSLRVAETGRRGAEQDIDTDRQDEASADQAYRQADADLRTEQAQPRAEVVAVAWQHVRDAQQTLDVTQAQAHDTIVRAPFDGIVTSITGQPGATVNTAGVVSLVGTDQPEIRIELDENDLGSLHLGQTAIITSSAYTDAETKGEVCRIGAQVDSSSGTIEVAIRYDLRLHWLRPGQTVNVNLITDPHAHRQLLPSSAVKRSADRNVVLVVQDGRAVEREVQIGPPVGAQIPLLHPLPDSLQVLANVDAVAPGARVRPVAGS